MIKRDEYGTYGQIYQCPKCGKDHGDSIHHITEHLPILCVECLNDDTTDINLRMKTVLHYLGLLQSHVENIDHVTSGLRIY
jgi:hypothetical protein